MLQSEYSMAKSASIQPRTSPSTLYFYIFSSPRFWSTTTMYQGPHFAGCTTLRPLENRPFRPLVGFFESEFNTYPFQQISSDFIYELNDRIDLRPFLVGNLYENLWRKFHGFLFDSLTWGPRKYVQNCFECRNGGSQFWKKLQVWAVVIVHW